MARERSPVPSALGSVTVLGRLVRRRWWCVALGTLLGVAGGVVVTATTTPVWVASTDLLVTARSEGTVSSAYVGGLFTDQRVASYVPLVGTAAARRAVAGDLGPDAPADLAGSVGARVLPGTTIVQVTGRGGSPDQARAVAAAFGRALAGLVEELETTPSGASAVQVADLTGATGAVARSSPDLLRDLAGGVLAGTLAGAATAVVLGRRRSRPLTGTTDVAEALAAPVVVVLRPRSAAGSGTEDARRERAHLTRLVRAGQVDGQVLVVGSTGPQDGGSGLAAALVTELAALGEEVELMGPTAAADGVTLQPPAGLLATLRAGRTRVVVDLPGPVTGPEARDWLAIAGGCVLLTRHGTTRVDDLARAAVAAGGVGCPVRVVVIDGVPRSVARAEGHLHRYPPDRDRERVGRDPRTHRGRRPGTDPAPQVPADAA